MWIRGEEGEERESGILSSKNMQTQIEESFGVLDELTTVGWQQVVAVFDYDQEGCLCGLIKDE